MSLTKEQIDALVDGMDRDGELIADATYIPARGTVLCIPTRDVRKALYKAAGLTASGERKPERVRCWLWQQHGKCDRIILVEPNCRLAEVDECFTPGWFVPDGAE